MAGLGKTPTLHIPDEGVWYYLDETVRIDRSAKKARLVKDPHGTYEVTDCEHMSTKTGDRPQLAVTLRLLGP